MHGGEGGGGGGLEMYFPISSVMGFGVNLFYLFRFAKLAQIN